MCCSVSILLLSQAFKAIIVVLFYYNDAVQHNINLHRKGLFLCLKLGFQECWAVCNDVDCSKKKETSDGFFMLL